MAIQFVALKQNDAATVMPCTKAYRGGCSSNLLFENRIIKYVLIIRTGRLNSSHNPPSSITNAKQTQNDITPTKAIYLLLINCLHITYAKIDDIHNAIHCKTNIPFFEWIIHPTA